MCIRDSGNSVRFRGVNRHEHDPYTARVMSEERMSVSYTHLDVYKRQLYNRPISSTTGFQNYLGNLGQLNNRGWELEPVSYTHLDGGIVAECRGKDRTHIVVYVRSCQSVVTSVGLIAVFG